MRAPSDLPRRRRRVSAQPRSRVWLVVLAVALFLLLTSLRGIAGFYTDYLWFDSLDFSSVFTGVLRAKILLGLIFTGFFFLLLWVNLLIADRLAPRFRSAGPEEELIERYRELIGERTALVRLAVSALFAVLAGAGVSGQWQKWILFTNAQDFVAEDPQFNTNVGFYVFRLPFLTFVVDWAFASVIIILVITAVAHYLNGGIRVQGVGQRVTPQVKAHLSVLLGLLALLKAAGYWLARFELNFSDRGAVDGATYTDVRAQLPVLGLLILISLAAFVLFIVNIWRRGWALPLIAVGLWAFVALLAGGIYPALVQRFSVVPAESAKEAPYIARNIEATRAALNLANVEPKTFAADSELDAGGLEANSDTVDNIRLWDPGVLALNYQRTQEVKDFYRFNDVDVDRYEIDGKMTQVELSTRELDTAGVPQDSWEARHLAYTHGYGLALAPANAKTSSGGPELVVRDIPVEAGGGITLDQPGLYIGEELTGYVVVGTNRREIDFEAQNETQFSEYEGADGVEIGSWLHRAAFALRFGDINPLISSNIRGDSKILFQRDVRERVEAVAPFLSFDADPYPVIVDGRIKYVLDAYTTSDRYPYAEDANVTGLSGGSGLGGGFNYVRNSVKAVVDAYEGTTTFYVVDDTDPLIAAYVEAFPDLFTPGDEVPDELRAHFRYPEDLFRVQTNMWGRYHISDPEGFYDQNDAWNVSPDPQTAGIEQTGTQSTNAQGEPVGLRRAARIDPYYQLLQLPGDEGEEFVIVRPFVPASGDDSQGRLTAFMVARSDGENYGQLETFVLPSGDQEPGPALIAANMSSDEEVSRIETLLGQRGSTVSFGNLVLIPLEESLLYVRPLYVTPEGNPIPELRKVVVSFGGEVQVADTLEQALTALFEDGAAPDPPPDEEVPPDEENPPPDEALPDDVAGLLEQASIAFEEAEAALATNPPDLGTYQERVERAQDLVARAEALLQEGVGAEPASTTTTTEAPSA